MANISPRESCSTCGKGTSIFKCQGCLQAFCTKHSTEHRQKLHVQLDEVVQEQDKLLQELTEKNDHFNNLVNRIKNWEDEWIEKVKQAARNAQQEIDNANRSIKEMLVEKIPLIREQLVKAKEDDDFIEIDLTIWSETLEQLKQAVLTHFQASPSSPDPISILEHKILGIASSMSDDETKDFVSVAESFTETSDEILHPSIETVQLKVDLDYQSSTQTNDAASTDDQSDQGESLQYGASVMRGPFYRGRFRQRGDRDTHDTATYGPSRARSSFGNYKSWNYYNPYTDGELPTYYAPENRGGTSRARKKSRGRSGNKDSDQVK